MDAKAGSLEYKDRSRVLILIGLLFLLGGVAVGLLGPVEMYCFYLFSEGGRFHYDGFGFGSFMFGNIASQIAGYYLLAVIFIPLGYGHLKLRRWVRKLSLTLLWSWLVVGAPLTLVVAFILLGSKDLSLPAALAALSLLGLSYLVFPGVLIRFYRSRDVEQTLAVRDAGTNWLEAIPVPLLVLGALYLFYIFILHIPILFNGMFPLFGVFRFGLPGIILLEVCMTCLAGLTWGTLRRRAWAWWGSVVWLGLFAVSIVLTFSRSSYLDILTGLSFPPQELEILAGIPAQGYHFAFLAGLPLLVTWVIALCSKRHFKVGP